MKLSRLFVLLMLAVLVLPVVYAQTAPISEVIAKDIGNLGNGADLDITFTTDALGKKHQLLIVPTEESFDFDRAMTSEFFLIVFPDTEQFSRTLNMTTKDVNGDEITEDIEYQVYILVDESDLSEPSTPITLRNETTVTTLVSQLGAGGGGMESDADGNIYFSDFGEAQSSRGSVVYRITPDGEVDIFFATDGLQGASGNAFDSQGNFFQSSINSNKVLKVTPEGEISFFAEGDLKAPVGIVVDDDDTLYVTNCQGASIQKITAEGDSSVFAESSLLSCPNGITMDDDNFYVSNYNNSAVLKITPDGEVSEFATMPRGTNAHILYRDGLLYVVSRSAYLIYTVTLDGDVEVFAGSGERGNDDGPALEASFNLPNDISFSPDGQVLYVNEVWFGTTLRNYPSMVRAIIFPRPDDE